MIYTNLLLIAVICVVIIDISGFIDHLKGWIGKYLKRPADKIHIKPLDCSFCTTHWVGLIYLLLTEFTLLYYAVLLVICTLTPVIADLILGVRELLTKLVRKIK